MYTLSEALRYEMFFLLVGLVVIVTYRLLTGRINTTGLLLDKMSGRVVSPGRLQMLIVTVSIALYYLFMVFDNEEPGKMPGLPPEFLLALGGSHVFYLGGKLYGMFFGLLTGRRLGVSSPPSQRRARLTIERRMKK